MNTRQKINRSTFCLFSLLLLTLFAAPVTAQVFDPGPSDPALFDSVINLPNDPDFDSQSFGGDGLTTQVNLLDGVSIRGFSLDTLSGSELNVSGDLDVQLFAQSGSEVNITGGDVFSLSAQSGSLTNISGGSIGGFTEVQSGSVVNISGGDVGEFVGTFDGGVLNISGGSFVGGINAFSGGEVNISGGSLGFDFNASSGGEVNLFGSNFVLDGVLLDSSLTIGDAFTINDRDVILSGVFDDGSVFSFSLNSGYTEPSADVFNPDATLTVTLTSTVLLGDVDQDGDVDFFDINPFIGLLLAQADINQDGEVTLLDIPPFIQILAAR